MEEPPAILDVEVFNFDGPFDLAISLGHAEINFLKHTSVEQADIWVPLEGKLAQTCQSRLHLRVFLENTKGPETSMREYLSKMEKEVGKKVNLDNLCRFDAFKCDNHPDKMRACAVTCSVTSQKFNIPEAFQSTTRRIPYSGLCVLTEKEATFAGNLLQMLVVDDIITIGGICVITPKILMVGIQ